jgi:hypothetical protein
MSPKKKSGKKKKGDLAGDPITVGGGGSKRIKGRLTTKPVKITFDDALYVDQDPNGTLKKKVFKHLAKVMKSLVVSINGVPTELSSLIPDPLDGECTVTIKCKGSAEDLEISSNPNRIKLHTGKYPPESGKEHKSQDGANFIKRVRVETDTDDGGSYDSGPLTADKSVQVVANTI